MKREELLVYAKPILFNTEMVKAILEDRKTVTRRVLKPKLRDGEYGCHIWYNKTLNRHIVEKYDEDESDFIPTRYVNQPYEVGDILYVRETWGDYLYDKEHEINKVYYRADYENGVKTYIHTQKDDCGENIVCDLPKWHPSIHMPKDAARIFLKVTNVRVERLQDTDEEDAKKEGFIQIIDNSGDQFEDAGGWDVSARQLFSILWDSTINKQDLNEYGWEANPYVWVIEFERVYYE